MPDTREEKDLWVTKVRRYGGGTCILNISTKEKAQKLADEFNENYQTDAYYIEEYHKELHAYSRHG